jgi:peptidoglycan LD-endopeptidase LytH
MNIIENLLLKNQKSFEAVVPFNAANHKLVSLNLTESNITLTEEICNDINLFCQYIENYIKHHNATYAIGGYNELRTMYSRSSVFSNAIEPRRLHIGTDIWGKAHTPVFAPIGGIVHSAAFNNAHGDYGGTIILQHQLEGYQFHTLYGHLCKQDVQVQKEGIYISMGQQIGSFGEPHENGNWPPHLHFQIIEDMQLKEGDYPGVCKASEASFYLQNCVNPNLILQLEKFL